MKNKGIVSIIEMVIIAIVLLTAFDVIFPRNVYQANWGVAQSLINSRDIVTTLDRLGPNRLYQYSYNQSALSDFARNIVGNATVVWFDTNGLIKSKINIDCNCTNSTIDTLNKWLAGATVNNRRIDYSICHTNLENINPCAAETPDVVIIEGFSQSVDGSIAVRSSIDTYLGTGGGIVELSDFPFGMPSAGGLNDRIFGIRSASLGYVSSNDTFLTPKSAVEISYTPNKYFFHIPLTATSYSNATALGIGSVPVDSGATCSASSIFNGTFRFYQRSYLYWICSNSVYFDTDNSQRADATVSPGTTFTINGTNFYMKSVNTSSFGIVFKPGYKFLDFVQSTLNQSSGDYTKVFLSNGNYSGTLTPIPVVVLNGTGYFRTAWISNFARNGFDSAGDDHRMLFISLLFWASNKHTLPSSLSNIAVGYSTSYINVVGGSPNDDMFEPYVLSMGLGQPY